MNYFAYGANMDPVRMKIRCPGARALGVARLPDHRLVFRRWRVWRTGLADVEPVRGETVWGVLWSIDEPCERRLDRYEAVHRDLYNRGVVRVVRTDEGAEDALIYLATLRDPKRPSSRYLRLILRGATANRLPAEYVAVLRSARAP